jgi:hypothetical protein
MPYGNQLTRTQSGKAPASGAVVLSFYSRGPYQFICSQVSVEMTKGTATAVSASAVCAIRLNGNLVSPAVAQGDAVAGEPPVVFGPSDVLTVEWSGATSGNQCSATITYAQDMIP